MMGPALLCCLLGVAVAQQQAPGTLNVNKHLVELNQAHLPKDPNNIAATERFLLEFARLKALSDAAPDIQTHAQFPQAAPAQQQQPVRQVQRQPVRQVQRQPVRQVQRQPVQQVQRQPVQLQQQHRFAAPVRTQAPTKAPSANTAPFDINSAISKLLQSVKVRNSNPTPAPRRAAPPAPVRQQPSTVRAGHQAGFGQQAPRMTITQANLVPISNAQGLVINPKQFNGPLAHDLPAAVNGPVQHTQFTPDVAAAHQALAEAHRNIIQQQIALQG